MKRRILLADDSVTIQKVIELTFMDEDFEVRAVSNGDEALALLPEVKPDFVIADVHMPGANGYEVCRRSKQLRISVPVLLLVGTFEPFDENEARAAGADSFLKKPFDSQELLQRVQELLAPMAQTAAAVPPPPPSPLITERTSLPTLDFPALAQPAAPVFPPEPVFPSEPVFSPEPSWGSFDLEAPSPAVSPPAIPPPPPFAVTAPEPFDHEPFDHEPSFALEPDPTYHVEEEPVFELEESPAPYELSGNVFSAPAELSEPNDRYMPEEEPAAPPPAAPAIPAVAGFDWAAAPEELPEAPQAPQSPQPWTPPAEFEPQTWDAAPEPEPQAWSVPAPPPAVSPAEAFPAAVGSAPEAGNGQHLSDGDVDRIARRLVELMGDKTVRDIAWEVIPDMAEVIIRDRLRELESQVE
ncbi:MAG TPA: response regulator [Thermoanaerobaculia bacterium]|jgi:CheY-like chemotaxis protein|nr:response regulator [Thermoanaerobaculia bacterium]